MSAYLPLIKQWHIVFALVSIMGFVARGVLMLRQSPLLQNVFFRRVPHVNDTLLFLFGITLLWLGPWTLMGASWLQAKLVALLIYIGLGFIALHRGRFSTRIRFAAWFSAILVFLYMLAVAHTKQPWPI